jgi:arabinogalactan oligomer/maltooligosaccharide transport system substrate-binding protein
MDWTSAWYVYAFFGNTGLEVGLNDDGLTNYCTWNAADGPIRGVDVAQAMLDIAGTAYLMEGADPVLKARYPRRCSSVLTVLEDILKELGA